MKLNFNGQLWTNGSFLNINREDRVKTFPIIFCRRVTGVFNREIVWHVGKKMIKGKLKIELFFERWKLIGMT
jgi:hypothetical protein